METAKDTVQQGVLQVGDLELNRGTREVFRNGHRLAMQPKAYEILVCLLDRRTRVVTKDELLDLLWPEETVAPEALTTAMRSLRVAIGDNARDQHYIRTVRGIGYQLVADVRKRTGPSQRAVSSFAQARHEEFIGRERELQRFRDLITGANSGVRLLFIHGPGGIGKTSMLQEFAYHCQQIGVASVQVQAEHVAAKPSPFEAAVSAAFDGGRDLDASMRDAPPTVLFIDGFELLAGLGSWFIDVFLPRLPEHITMVLASRTAPRARWRSDPAWRALAVEISLQPFDDQESERFLVARGVTSADVGPIRRFSQGHPLALAVAAAAVERGADPHDVSSERDVIDVLVEVFTARAPSPLHREALEAASLLSSFNESLLTDLLEVDDASELYTWLASLSFVRPVPTGLQVHALVRDALLAHLGWRNPQRLGALAAHCYALHIELLRQTTEPSFRMVLTNRIMSLGRHHSTLRPHYHDDSPELAIELASNRASHGALIEIVRCHEGETSAGILQRWLDLEIGDLWIAPDGGDIPAGFVLVLQLPSKELDAYTWDPVISAIRRYLGWDPQRGQNEYIVVYRYIVARDGYQENGLVMQRCHEILNYDLHSIPMMEGEITHSFNVYGQPEVMAPVNAFADFHELEDYGVELGGRRFGIFGHSWREVPLEAWAERIARKLAQGPTSL